MAEVVGSYGVTVRVKDNSEQFLKETERNIKSALKAMADATLQRSLMLQPAAPYKTGQLHATGLTGTRQNGFESFTQFGAGIDYAAYQERGMRADGTHVVRNYTSAGTGAHFLETAGDSVAKDGIQTYL